ncbi:MAG: PAS domain S-box protein [Terriglobales bacterium]
MNLADLDEAAFLRQPARLQAEICLDHLPDGVLVVDGVGKILMVNQAFCRFAQYSEKELRLKNLSMLLPDGLRRRHAKWFQSFNADADMPVRRMGDAKKPFPLRRRDGTCAPVDIAISRAATKAGRLCIAVVRWAQ